MRVSTTARLAFREALGEARLANTYSDEDLDKFITEIRKSLNSAPVLNSLVEETELAIETLRPLYGSLTDWCSTEDLDSDQWANMCWDLFTAAVNTTKAGTRLPNLAQSVEAWADMVTLLLPSLVAEPVIERNRWLARLSIWAEVLALAGVLAFGATFQFANRIELGTYQS